MCLVAPGRKQHCPKRARRHAIPAADAERYIDDPIASLVPANRFHRAALCAGRTEALVTIVDRMRTGKRVDVYLNARPTRDDLSLMHERARHHAGLATVAELLISGEARPRTATRRSGGRCSCIGRVCGLGLQTGIHQGLVSCPGWGSKRTSPIIRLWAERRQQPVFTQPNPLRPRP